MTLPQTIVHHDESVTTRVEVDGHIEHRHYPAPGGGTGMVGALESASSGLCAYCLPFDGQCDCGASPSTAYPAESMLHPIHCGYANAVRRAKQIIIAITSNKPPLSRSMDAQPHGEVLGSRRLYDPLEDATLTLQQRICRVFDVRPEDIGLKHHHDRPFMNRLDYLIETTAVDLAAGQEWLPAEEQDLIADTWTMLYAMVCGHAGIKA